MPRGRLSAIVDHPSELFPVSAPAPVPPPPPPPGAIPLPPPPARRPWARVWLLLVPLLVLTAGLTLLGGLATAPYSTLAPGDARDATPLVTVSGAKTYTHRGKVLFVTVSVLNRPRYLQALWGWLDPDVDVFPRNDITSGRNPTDDNRYNQVLMQLSQQSAVYQALKRLGYRVQQSAAGVLIDDVSPTAPVAGKLKAGDVIRSLDGFSINSGDDLRLFLKRRSGGEHVQAVVDRLGVSPKLQVPITLGSKTVDGRKTAYLGIVMETMPRFHTPFNVEFDTGPVGGPSAGLAFTVTLIDELTPGGVTKGNTVAVTGTMQSDGTVGDVGGVAQKTIAVRDAGADYFLVPADEYKEAVKHAGSHLKVIKVATLEEAVRVLHALPAKTAR